MAQPSPIWVNLRTFSILEFPAKTDRQHIFHRARVFCHLGRSFSTSNQNNAAHLLPKPLIRQAAVANGLILRDTELSRISAAKGSLWREHSLFTTESHCYTTALELNSHGAAPGQFSTCLYALEPEHPISLITQSIWQFAPTGCIITRPQGHVIALLWI